MQRRRIGIWVYYVIAALVFAIDYVTKKLIEHNLDLYQQVKVIGDFFIITFIHNRGAAFGILQEQRWFFLLITVLVVSAIVWYLHRSHRHGRGLLLVALALVLGGALGNFLDRAIYGQVVDFMQFNFGSYTFPIFNAADCAIVVGVAMIILDSLLAPKRENGHHDQEQDRQGEQLA
ncbi:signal peptidase II [Cohnella nanjingensis]|uniref:Lipoprotein signal peptidase n=1 Tax=Cohnella nanjingensis TaxID=1387779 RepID=A0A7X0RT32_9BACL|nr:signal peptidase II [Cohnella nanjingensis]MBB6673199.1 signal peptidase II [Cohnella nanjingensis]